MLSDELAHGDMHPCTSIDITVVSNFKCNIASPPKCSLPSLEWTYPLRFKFVGVCILLPSGCMWVYIMCIKLVDKIAIVQVLTPPVAVSQKDWLPGMVGYRRSTLIGQAGLCQPHSHPGHQPSWPPYHPPQCTEAWKGPEMTVTIYISIETCYLILTYDAFT